MATILPGDFESIQPSESDVKLARESSLKFAAHELRGGDDVRIRLLVGDEATEAVAVPASVLRILLQVLREMSEGRTVTLMPSQAELTTQQAADLLNVSRPYLVKLLDEGKLPCRTVGKYRRVRFDDLAAFKRKDDEARLKVLEQLTAEAQELGLGY